MGLLLVFATIHLVIICGSDKFDYDLKHITLYYAFIFLVSALVIKI